MRLLAPPAAPGGHTQVGEQAQELVALAVQLDLIARRGSDPGPLLAILAQSVADDYQAAVDRQAEKLNAQLLLPTFFFFFVPFLIIVLVPLLHLGF